MQLLNRNNFCFNTSTSRIIKNNGNAIKRAQSDWIARGKTSIESIARTLENFTKKKSKKNKHYYLNAFGKCIDFDVVAQIQKELTNKCWINIHTHSQSFFFLTNEKEYSARGVCALERCKLHTAYKSLRNHLPRLICLVLRLWRQHPIISMLINTNDVPDAIPTINNVPEIACVGVVLVVGGPPSDDAGWPVGGASTFRFQFPYPYGGHSIRLFHLSIYVFIGRKKKNSVKFIIICVMCFFSVFSGGNATATFILF